MPCLSVDVSVITMVLPTPTSTKPIILLSTTPTLITPNHGLEHKGNMHPHTHTFRHKYVNFFFFFFLLLPPSIALLVLSCSPSVSSTPSLLWWLSGELQNIPAATFICPASWGSVFKEATVYATCKHKQPLPSALSWAFDDPQTLLRQHVFECMCKRERGVGEGKHAQFSLRCFLVQTLTLVRPIVLTGEQNRGIGQGQVWTLIRKKKYTIQNYQFFF